ncbi:CD3324 family protein [Paenibacillus sp. RC67]|uniref:CD3324 family protein n=1 Tax=Paenibacillus sp. RC67 TaxID=3039392 RepID=UPI0024ACF705|nr:CD3324 family protein [Paenibacillus sp. RC67]
MKYVNAEAIFPKELLNEIQKYVHGGIIYIPNPEGTHKKWGEKSGSRTYLNARNEEIREKFSNGASIHQLSDLFCLSCDSIKKIIYSKK